jgi:hypothetical protein
MIAARQIAFGGSKRKPYDAEIEYLESTGTQYIDTGIVPTTATTVQTNFAFTKIPTSAGGPFGVRSDNNNTRFWLNYDKVLEIGYGYYYKTSVALDTNEYIDVLFNSISGDNHNFVFGSYSAICKDVFLQNGVMYLFALNRPPSNVFYASLKMTFLKIWHKDVLIRDFIPVRVGSVGYMYDRVSGQLFSNQGTGEFVLGPDIIDYTAKDYIQDGLVAMWDGIENAGWGVHDPSATVWKDLVGTRDLNVNPTAIWEKDGTYNTFGAHAFLVGKEYAIPGQESTTVESAFCWDGVFQDPRSVAVVFTTTDVQGGQNAASMGRLICITSARLSMDFSGKKGFPVSKVGINSLTSISASGYNDSPTSSAVLNYLNGSSNGLTTGDARDGDAGISVGGRMWNGVTPFYGMQGVMHSVRLYSRALAAEEIAHNYEIDKARFGL